MTGPGTEPGGELLTVGHGTLGQDAFTQLLTQAGVELLVDVRRYPGSRAHPHVSRDAMAQWLPEAGVRYRWEPRLGGRRSLKKSEDTTDPWWRVPAFRAYSAYTRDAEFDAGLAELLSDVADRRTVVCCSEAVWWRCHRRIISDVVCLTTDVAVRHLGHDRRLTEHPVAEGARVAENGRVVWDGAS